MANYDEIYVKTMLVLAWLIPKIIFIGLAVLVMYTIYISRGGAKRRKSDKD